MLCPVKIGLLMTLSLAVSACKNTADSNTQDAVGPNGHTASAEPDPTTRTFWKNIDLSPTFIAHIRQADPAFDPAQHCLQLVYDARKANPNNPDDLNFESSLKLELSASGPCPARQAVTPFSRVVAYFWVETESIYHPNDFQNVTNSPIAGKFENPQRFKLSSLCTDYQADNCRIFSRNGRICAVIPQRNMSSIVSLAQACGT